MKSVIFLGPSLSREAAKRMLPTALFLPPAAQADVLSAVETYSPDVIGLIDGAFQQSLSTWHKEILFALHRGVRVLGAASMGALRAAELESFGMQGVGEVFRQFRTGELTDDDEVALVHASAADDFRALSEPMVNVRATLARARDAGILDADEAQGLIDTAKALHFSQRTVPNILTGAALSVARVAVTREVFRTGYQDVKAADAQLLLETVRSLPDDPPLPRPMVRSPGFERLYNSERTVQRSGIDVTLRSIAVHSALTAPDFDDLNFTALNRALALVLAEVLQIQPTAAEIDAEAVRFRRQRGLTDPAGLDAWLQANDLDSPALAALIRELATSRRLHRWLLGGPRGVHHTRWLLDELRLRGRYSATADAVAQQPAWPFDVDSVAELDPALLMDLVPAHLHSTGWQLNVPVAEWAEEAGFSDVKDLAYELLRARRLRELDGA